MKLGAFVRKLLLVVSYAKRAEVLGSLGNDVSVQLELESSFQLSPNGNVEEASLLEVSPACLDSRVRGTHGILGGIAQMSLQLTYTTHGV